MKHIEFKLDQVLQKLEEMSGQLSPKKAKESEYISEQEAKKILPRGTTWFWERRRTGELPYTKLGGQVYYKRSDLIKYLEERYKDINL